MSKSADPVIQLDMVDGVRVVAPQPLRSLTTYVLREQGDWFEDEIKFLRRYLQPKMQVIDIGANLGVYTLSMAKTVGESGHVWAFEPASQTARMLQSSIKANRFSNVTLVARGLSNRTGQATFNLAASSELNSLNPVSGSTQSETIGLTTLDHWAADVGLKQLDFIKLDAEGEESRILEGAGKTLAAFSPLVMFELKHAKQVNLPLITNFRKLGFETYRMIPGIGKLVPFDPSAEFDPYLLNLFACTTALADDLADSNFLVRKSELVDAPGDPEDLFVKLLLAEMRGASCQAIHALPFAAKVDNADDWKPGTGGEFEQMLDCYIGAKSSRLPAAKRWQLLRLALSMSRRLTSDGTAHPGFPVEKAATHARIARDAGEQNRAVKILLQAIGSNHSVSNLRLSLPFLPAVARYDRLNPGERLNRWMVSSVIEQYVRDHAYSTYFTARKALPALQRLSTLGFISPAMQRRLKLVSSVKLNQ